MNPDNIFEEFPDIDDDSERIREQQIDFLSTKKCSVCGKDLDPETELCPDCEIKEKQK